MRGTTLLVALSAVALAGCGSSVEGGPDAGAAGGADSGVAGADASVAGADAALPPPLDFTVTLSASCGFTACGGAVLGTWDYSGLCLSEQEILAPLQASCSAATVLSATGSGKGRVSFDALRVSRDIDWSGTASLNLPATCAAGSCAAAQAALRQIAGFGTATCTGTGSCTCTVPLAGKVKSLDSYAVVGTQLRVSGGHDYEFCVAGSSLKYDDVTAPNGELGVATMNLR